MAFMSGSPVLTDERFGQETRQAYAERPTGLSTMTVGGTVTAAGVLMVLLVAAAAFGWSQVTQTIPKQVCDFNGNCRTPGPDIPSWIFVTWIGALVFGLVTSFKPKLARITAPLYALLMGAGIGAISAVYNFYYSGIVTQALFATLGIFVAMLFLYITRIIKVTNRFVMIVVGATMGIFLMYLLAWIVGLFSPSAVQFLNDGSPLAILLSVGIIIFAALNLAIDFAFIEKATMHGVPKYMEWFAAYGVVVTLVWIYLEVLRLLAMLNRR
jgi:uncharacterized YccA/Bax inhibitor family protein